MNLLSYFNSIQEDYEALHLNEFKILPGDICYYHNTYRDY